LVKSLEDNLIYREKNLYKIFRLNGTINSALERNRELKTLGRRRLIVILGEAERS